MRCVIALVIGEASGQWLLERCELDFELTEEQKQIRKTVREFAEKEIRPHVMEWDEAQQFPSEIISKLGQMGLMGVTFPTEYGGAGLGYVEYVGVIEELARVDGSVAIILAAHTSLCSGHIYLAGSEEQKRKYLTSLARGEKLGCWSLTEPQAGSDAGGTRTTARLAGDTWVLNGSKNFTSNGSYAGAFEASVNYAKQRKQFGRPIGSFQAIQWKLADMATEIEAARLLTHQAAALADRGRPVTKEGSMAKLFAGEVAVKVANEAVQIHGGYGVIKE